MFCFRLHNQLIDDGYVIFSVNPFLWLVQIFPGKFKFKIEKVYYLSCYLLFYRTFNFELKIRAFFSFRLWSLIISFFLSNANLHAMFLEFVLKFWGSIQELPLLVLVLVLYCGELCLQLLLMHRQALHLSLQHLQQQE